MSERLLDVEGLSVSVEGKELLHDIHLHINKGETHVLMGPNGAGKSTLGYALMGHPRYQVDGGEILFQGKRINEESPDKRAKDGIFLSFQSPLEIPGLPLHTFVRNALEQKSGERVRLWDFRKELEQDLDFLQMDREYAEREFNVGFSGGEKKKAEILQLLLLKPSLAILDETDSGLDVDAVRTVSKGVEEYQKNQDGALLIITHSTGILKELHVDYTHILVDGRIIQTGDASLIDEINRKGFEQYIGRLEEEPAGGGR